MNEALVIFGFIVIFVSSEILLRMNVLEKESARKCTHIVSGAFALCTPFLISHSSIVRIAVFFSIVLLLLHKSPYLGSITIANRKTHGTWLMPLGIGAAAFLYPSNDIFIASVAIVAFADGLAGVAGRKSDGKTHRGSLIFFVVCYFILVAHLFLTGGFSLLSLTQHLLIALLLTAIERLASYGLDNLLLPVIAGALLSFIA